MTRPALSRRTALLLGLGGAASACQRRERNAAQQGAGERRDSADRGTSAISEQPFGGLQLETAGDLSDNERGGNALVLLHGYGASGDDLLPLAHELAAPRTRAIVPAGPLELPNGGRAWWPLPSRLSYDDQQELRVPEQQLNPARAAVLGLLQTIQQRFAPDSLFLVGFSQGAMLALDVGLDARAKVARIGVLSGALVDDAAAKLTAAPAHPRVFVSHGRQDHVLRFKGAEHLVEALQAHALSVTFQPFDGGHEINATTLAALKEFLFADAG